MPDVTSPARTRAKALSYIRDGRVAILRAVPGPELFAPPRLVTARVQGFQDTYLIAGEQRGKERRWRCPCRPEPQRDLAQQCTHAAAAALVVGWPSAAALPPALDRAGGQPPEHRTPS